mmetsp:Transcript_43638/g.115305  ORF Transcript_43638/g.115305 Transcript_43638/m.115305 type:complete len:118 (+) Transcript_43638:1347-1700(+)
MLPTRWQERRPHTRVVQNMIQEVQRDALMKSRLSAFGCQDPALRSLSLVLRGGVGWVFFFDVPLPPASQLWPVDTASQSSFQEVLCLPGADLQLTTAAGKGAVVRSLALAKSWPARY